MKIRRAKPEDLPRLLEMAERFLTETEYAGRIAFVPEHAENLLRKLGSSPDSLLLVADTGEAVVGMIAFVIYPHPFSLELVGGEVFWWSEKGSAGLKLLRAAEAWAIAKGATILHMVAPNEKVAKMYQHFGYELLETHYQRRL